MAFKFSKASEKDEKREILEDIKNVQEKLSQNSCFFDMATSSEMIDYAVYKERALKAQYDYLLRLYKEK